MSKSESLIFIGMDVHQDTVTLAVFEGASKAEPVNDNGTLYGD